MKVTKKALSELKHPEKNVRMHTDKQLVEFRRSVEMFGQIRPIVIDEDNVILAGNGLYETLVSMGRSEADCYVVTGLSDKEKKKLMLADNRIFDLGVDDMKAFDEVIAELGDDLDVPGYDEDLLQTLIADTDDVDDMMSSYGLVDQEQKASIEKQSESIKSATETVQYEQPVNASNDTESETQSSGKYAVCPKCGEKIWL